MVLCELKSPAYIQGEAKAGMELPSSFVFDGLYTLTTVVFLISLSVHSTSLSVIDELIVVQLAEFFTNVAVPLVGQLLIVQAARL